MLSLELGLCSSVISNIHNVSYCIISSRRAYYVLSLDVVTFIYPNIPPDKYSQNASLTKSVPGAEGNNASHTNAWVYPKLCNLLWKPNVGIKDIT